MLLTEMSISPVLLSIFAAMSRITELRLTKAFFNDEAQFLFELTCILVLCHVSCFVLDQKSYISCK